LLFSKTFGFPVFRGHISIATPNVPINRFSSKGHFFPQFAQIGPLLSAAMRPKRWHNSKTARLLSNSARKMSATTTGIFAVLKNKKEVNQKLTNFFFDPPCFNYSLNLW
jgi:hypothetical protein